MPASPPPPPHSPSAPRSRTPLWIVAGLAAVGLVAAGATLARAKSAKKASSVVVIRDVPQMEGGAIVFSAAYRERAGVAFTKAERAPFKPVVRLVGTVAFNPTYIAAIGTRLRGTVRRTFKYEGDHVAANEPLAEVESAELGEAQATIGQAEAIQTAAEVQAKREKELLDKGLTTARESEIAEAELVTARASLRAAQNRVRTLGGSGAFGVFVLRSPIAGHVVERNVAAGQSVDSNVVGYKIANLEHLWIELSVFERDLDAVHLDDPAYVSPMSNSNDSIVGRVAHVGEVIDPTTRSTSVRVAVDHPKFHLRVGQSVQATITSRSTARDALLVPSSAIIYVDGRPTVFVAEGDTRARAVPIRIGGTDGTRHEVLEGLTTGDSVASAGVFALKSELFR